MLGVNGEPNLLVEVERDYSPTNFDFWVVNGAWNGTFNNGHVTVWHPKNPWTSLEKSEVICDDQHLLHGDYAKVFNHFECRPFK